jgi:hypothetical protein
MSYHLLVDPFRTERAEGSNILTCHSFCEEATIIVCQSVSHEQKTTWVPLVTRLLPNMSPDHTKRDDPRTSLCSRHFPSENPGRRWMILSRSSAIKRRDNHTTKTINVSPFL